MKKILVVTLISTCALFFSNALLANHEGYRDSYYGPQVTGGAAIWIDSYGNAQYAANVAYGAPYGYAARPYYGRNPEPRCNHRSHRSYERGYYEGYAQGKRKGNKHRRKHGHGKHGHH